jgi:hypothetical protein
MGKEQISLRLESKILRQIDELAANENRTRDNMLEILSLEAINNRLFEQMERLADKNLEGKALDTEIKRSHALTGTKRSRSKKSET